MRPRSLKSSAPTPAAAATRDATRRAVRNAARNAARYAVEALEGRRLLAVSPIGSEFNVNTVFNGNQASPAVASDADGDFVVVWESFGQEGPGNSSAGIHARRFSATGVPLGEEFQVNTFTASAQREPSVAMDADGDFVVAWQSNDQDGEGYGVYAQRFDAAGNRLGGEFRANSFTAGNEGSPAVATDAPGNFLIAWEAGPAFSSSDPERDVRAQRFDADGNRVGGEIHVNEVDAGLQCRPAAAMGAAGGFVVTWQLDPSPSAGIFARRFDAAGNPLTRDIAVESTGRPSSPAVAMDADGDFTVAWESADSYGFYRNVRARRFDAAGVARGGTIPVNVQTSGFRGGAAVAMDADGDFTVAWLSQQFDAGTGTLTNGIFARRFSAAGVPETAGELQAHTTAGGSRTSPAVAADAEGDFVVAWDGDGPDGPGIVARRFDESSDTAGPVVTGVWLDGGEPVRPGAAFDRGASALVLGFSENLSVAGGTTGANSATNPANYRLVRSDGVDFSGHIASAALAFNPAARRHEVTLTLSARLGTGLYELRALPGVRDPAGNALDGDYDGTPGGAPFTRQFILDPYVRTGAEDRVNAAATGSHAAAAVAAEDDGDYVVVWLAVPPGGARSIRGQRFGADGRRRGPELQISGDFANLPAEASPAVAVDADGDFVVAWHETTASGHDVFARRYDPAGAPKGGPFKVNSHLPGAQQRPAVATDADGDFVVAWESDGQDGSAYGIYAQQYDAAGNKRGNEFLVNTADNGNQEAPTVAVDADGDFVVAWKSGSSITGVAVQRFSAAGARLGGETYVTVADFFATQVSPSVAAAPDGAFVVAWVGYSRTDLFAEFVVDGVYARRFGANGSPLGNAFKVNTWAADGLYDPEAAMAPGGAFVIAWEAYALGNSGTPNGSYIRAQRFSESGAARDTELPVNSTTGNSNREPDVAMTGGGDFVFAWHASRPGPGFNTDVFVQRYALERPPTTIGLPAVTVQQDETDTVVNLWEAFDDYNDPDHLLAYAVVGNTSPGLFTATTVSSAGGTLTLDYAPGRSGQATLTVRATDRSGQFVDTSFLVTVTPTPGGDPPSVTGVFADSTAWTAAFRNALQARGLGTSALGYLVPAGAAQLNDLPWSNVNRLRVVFSKHVIVQQADLAVRGVSVPTYAFKPDTATGDANDGFVYDPATFTATWTLAANIGPDKLRLVLDATTAGGVADAAGNRLDGEWADGGDTFPSGDGTPGGDFRFRLDVLPGNIDGAGAVNLADFGRLRAAFGQQPLTATSIFADLTGDGAVNLADFGVLRQRFGNSLPAANPA